VSSGSIHPAPHLRPHHQHHTIPPPLQPYHEQIIPANLLNGNIPPPPAAGALYQSLVDVFAESPGAAAIQEALRAGSADV